MLCVLYLRVSNINERNTGMVYIKDLETFIRRQGSEGITLYVCFYFLAVGEREREREKGRERERLDLSQIIVQQIRQV